MRISPLAAKLCARQGIDPATLHGTGPRGRIMAADVKVGPRVGRSFAGQSVRAVFAEQPADTTGPEGYTVYVGKAPAPGRLPEQVAVQRARLGAGALSFRDYIARALVKAALRAEVTSPEETNLLLRNEEGDCAVPAAARKPLCRLAQEAAVPAPLPQDFTPQLVLCFPGQGAATIRDYRPRLVLECAAPGPEGAPYSLYASPDLPRASADTAAASLHLLVENPVALLLLP